MKRQMADLSKTKKEISKYVHSLVNRGYINEAEEFLLQCLVAGDRSTIILGSLMNIYKMQGGRWQEVEELAREYLILKPKNSFAQSALELALKIQGKGNSKEKVKVQEEQKPKEKEENKAKIQKFRRKIYEGEISLENIDEGQLLGFTEFEKKILLAELYSHINMATKAVQLLKQAEKQEGITPREKKIVIQALQLAKSKNMGTIQKRRQWGYLSEDDGRAE